MPERRVFIHIQGERDTDFSASACGRHKLLQSFPLPFIDVRNVLCALATQRTLTAISGNVFFSIAKGNNSKTAFVIAESAGCRLRGVGKMLQLL